MPTFTGKTFASFYKNILGLNQSSNTGVDNITRVVHDGAGNSTSISLSDDVFKVQPINDDTTLSFNVLNKTGDSILSVDTTNSIVRVGAGNIAANTMYKEMGLYDFSPLAGYHYPLVANTMHFESAYAADSDWGNGSDPPTTLDVSGLTAQENAVAVYWYLDDNITLDSVRYMATADGSATLNFHLFSYALDTSSNYGDLSDGTVQASGTVAATATTIKTGTLSLDAADIVRNRVVIGFVENVTDTSDVSIALTIKYHLT